VRTDFRETSPTLSGTCFGTDDLILARSVYESVFADIDPEWPNDPTGPLAAYWRAVDSHSAAYLIHLARVLWQLSNKNVTAKSFPILRNKVQMLLRPPSSTSYEETLIELEVASSLSERISPISFEPLVPAGLSNAPSKPTSPDYGLRLPDSDVTVEVTVWHWQVLRNWDVMTSELKTRLAAKLDRSGVRRHVSIELPLKASSDGILDVIAKTAIQEMSASATGELELDTTAGNAKIQWFEVPRFQSIDQVDFTQLPPGLDVAIVGACTVESVFGCSTQPIMNDRSIDDALRSLRKALDRKINQRHRSLPHVLTLGLGHQRLHWDWVLPMFAQRIWPNEKYKWISALCAFDPQRNWTLGAARTRLTFEWNPSATIPAPNSLRATAEAGASYHM
jgi:hypothetical protein